jgi:hypothetical protein
MLTIHNRKNTTQRLRDKPEDPLLTGGQEEIVKPALVYMPFDNCGQYADLWKVCSKYLEDFETIDTLNVKVIESKANKEKYSLLKHDNTTIFDELSGIHVSAILVLLRYKTLVKELSNKTFKMVSDFFHELESTREYHARQLYVLSKANKHELEPTLKPHVLSLKPIDLEILDKILFNENQKLNETPYECIWLLNHLMIHLATFEIKTFPTLFKEDYLAAIVADNVSNLPSNVRLLSRITERKKEKILELYPSSILMCYSHFYPIHLYHTGTSPT